MVRSRTCAVLLLAAVGSFLPNAGGVPQDPNAKVALVNPVAVQPKAEPRKSDQLREKIARPIDLPKGIDPNTPLKDALEFLGQLQEITILIDQVSFKAADLMEPEQVPVGLPKLTGLAYHTVLGKLLSQLTPPATFVIRDNHLVVLPRAHVALASWVEEKRHLAPLVEVQFNRRPLDAALREVADQTGVSIVIDARVGDKAKAAVTATLTQVATDTAVLVLTDMAGLRVVSLDTILYVTTKEYLDELRKEQLSAFSGLLPTEK